MGLFRVLLSAVGLFSVTVTHAALQQETTSKLRFAHFSADASAVDVYLNDEIISLDDIQFGEITAWIPVGRGVYTLMVVSAGAVPENVLFESQMIIVGDDDWLTLVLNGLVADDSLTLRTLTENYSELPAGETRLSFYHAASGIPALDVIANGNTLFQLVTFPDMAVNERVDDGFVTVDIVANTYTIQIRESIGDEVLFNLGEVELLPNRHYFVGFIGTADNFRSVQVSSPITGGVSTVVEVPPVEETGTVGQMRVVHLASGSPDVDFYINERLSEFQRVGFTQITEFMSYPAGDYEIVPVSVGSPRTERLNAPAILELGEGEWVSIAAIGTTENDTFQLQVLEEDFSPLDAGLARISIVHALPGEGAVNVQLADGTVLLSLLGYPGSQGDNDGIAHFELVTDTYDLQIVAADDPERVIVDFGEVRIADGFHYFIALINANPPFVFNYVEIDE